MTEKHATFTFLRANPPTLGHKKVIDAVKAHAAKTGGDHHVFLSHTHDSKKNPLTHTQKSKYLHTMAPGTNIHTEKDVASPIHAAAHLHKMGYTHVTMLVGHDRHQEMSNLLHKYNGVEDKKGNGYHFKHLEVKSAGHRDPDSEGVEGMSGTKMREHAAHKKFSDFKKGTGNAKHAKEMYHAVRKGLKLESNQAIILVGGPGSGKDFIVRTALSEAIELSLDKLNQAITDRRDLYEINNNPPLIVNGNADDDDKVMIAANVLEAMGYQTALVYVYTTDAESQSRNNVRIKNGEKTISEAVRAKKYTKAIANLHAYKECFEPAFALFDNSQDFRVVNEAVQHQIIDWMVELTGQLETIFEGKVAKLYVPKDTTSKLAPPSKPFESPIHGYERVKQGSFWVLKKKETVKEDINDLFEKNMAAMLGQQKPGKKASNGDKYTGGGIAQSSKNKSETVVAETVGSPTDQNITVDQTQAKGAKFNPKKPRRGMTAPSTPSDSKLGTVPSGGIGLTSYKTEGTSFTQFRKRTLS